MSTLNNDFQALVARFEDGVSADPTQNMSPEDAAKWKAMNDEHGDKFKTANFQTVYKPLITNLTDLVIDLKKQPFVASANRGVWDTDKEPGARKLNVWRDDTIPAVFGTINVTPTSLAEAAKVTAWLKTNARHYNIKRMKVVGRPNPKGRDGDADEYHIYVMLVNPANKTAGAKTAKTFAQARADILAHLKAEGWKVKEFDINRMKPMKVPRAKSPNGHDTLWFQAQAVYLNAHSLSQDIRNLTPQAFMAVVHDTIESRKSRKMGAGAKTASSKTAGFSIEYTDAWFAFVGNGPFNKDTIEAIRQINDVPFKDEEGTLHDGDVTLRVLRKDYSGPLTYYQEKEGQVRENIVQIQFPKGMDRKKLLAALQTVGKKFKLKVEALSGFKKPETRGRKAAGWEPPKLNSDLARQVSKHNKTWGPVVFKNLDSIRDAIAKAVANDLSMADRVEHQAAIKKWKAGISDEAVRTFFRQVEKLKSPASRGSDEWLSGMKSASDALTTLASLDLELTAGALPGVGLDKDAAALEEVAKLAALDLVADQMIGRTILEQMGGQRRLSLMLGVKQLILLKDGVAFAWPNRESSKGNYVEIRLNGADLYDVAFFNASRSGKKLVKKFDDLYAEDLVNTFERQTGWYLRMASQQAHLLVRAAGEQMAKFEEGVSADPTKNMSPEDAAEWKKQNEANKDKFKTADLGDGLVAEGCPDNLDEGECAEWESNTEKYKDSFKSAGLTWGGSPAEVALVTLYNAGEKKRWHGGFGVYKDKRFSTPVLKKLMKDGFIEGEHFDQNNRPTNVSVTPKGQAVAAKLLAADALRGQEQHTAASSLSEDSFKTAYQEGSRVPDGWDNGQIDGEKKTDEPGEEGSDVPDGSGNKNKRASFRMAATPKYQDYVEKKKNKGEKPLSKPQQKRQFMGGEVIEEMYALVMDGYMLGATDTWDDARSKSFWRRFVDDDHVAEGKLFTLMNVPLALAEKFKDVGTRAQMFDDGYSAWAVAKRFTKGSADRLASGNPKVATIQDGNTLQKLVEMEMESIGATGDFESKFFRRVESAAAVWDSAVEDALLNWVKKAPQTTFNMAAAPLRRAQDAHGIVEVLMKHRGGAGYLYYMEMEGAGVGTWDGDWDVLFQDPHIIHDLSKHMASVLRSQFQKLNKAISDAAFSAMDDDVGDGHFASKAAARIPSGLYGHTKRVQADCDSCINRVQKSAARIAKTVYGRNEQVAEFLSIHAKRANSLPAKILVAALKGLGPRVASDITAAEARMDRLVELRLASLDLTANILVNKLGSNPVVLTSIAPQGVHFAKVIEAAENLHKLGFATFDGVKISKLTDGDSQTGEGIKQTDKKAGARSYGLYGYAEKVAAMGLQACTDLRHQAGRHAYDLHSRRADNHSHISDYFGNHSKQAKCMYSRLLAASYPALGTKVASTAEAPRSVQAWLEWVE